MLAHQPTLSHQPAYQQWTAAFDEVIDVFPSYTRPETGVIKAVVAVGD